MVFKDNFVAVIKCNGKILREKDGYIYLPFGSEYTILLKNLESRKAVVDIDIDGQDVLDGDKLIIDVNSEVELKGFKKKKEVTNRFKFIQKTDEIAEHRGDKIDDGVIRIEVTYEQKTDVTWHYHYDYHPWRYDYWYHPNMLFCNTYDGSAMSRYNNVSETTSRDVNTDEGITVKGSDNVDQKFQVGYTNTLESQSHVITLRLKGTNEKLQEIQKPITVKEKLECSTCGRKSKSDQKYCGNCGTFLE